MVKINLIISTIMFLKSSSCWVVNDINTKMLADMLGDDFNEIEAAIIGREINLIYPGTKWCGSGNIADNNDDLGSERETDMCCREHDNCPDIIPGGETKYNLKNPVFYTRLNCECDNTFYKCLKAVDKKSSRVIGNIYFNALQTECFREDYPVVKCLKKGGWFNAKCLEYEYDTNGNKDYQWFDVPQF